jgi:hypothetical protein
MKTRSTVGVLFLLLAFGIVAAAQPPDFSGTWVPVDSATTAPPLPPSVPGGPPPPPPPPRTLSLGISQSATHLTLDRRMEVDGREMADRVLYRFGAETVHTTGVLTFRTKAAWEGDTLVLSSTVSHEGNALGDLRETYRLVDGTLVVESTRKSAAGTFTGRTVHARRP